MNFLLKILEGPNKGAEVALPEGVALTLGKADTCDIVLADATLPDSPLSLEASAAGVALDGAPLAPFHVEKRGATAFAVGPADAPWSDLVWPQEERLTVEPLNRSTVSESEPPASEDPSEASTVQRSNGATVQRSRRLVPILLAALALLLVLAAVVALALPRLSRHTRSSSLSGESGPSSPSRLSGSSPASSLAALAERHGLVLSGDGASLSGNFATRAERLAATAEAYAARPGVELDFSDDESLRTAAEDALALVGETDLRVLAATNRVLVLSGTPLDLPRALDALVADIPKLRDVDVAGVALPGGNGGVAGLGRETPDGSREDGMSSSRVSRLAPKPSAPSLPVCGILTTPYPCLVLRNGSRVLEGAPVGEWTVAKIGADSVVLTNAERSVTWKP